jgi:hypothetical protein
VIGELELTAEAQRGTEGRREGTGGVLDRINGIYGMGAIWSPKLSF